MLNPFDPKTALLAKHAQHVVLIHFPIALYLAGTFFDVCQRIFRRPGFGEAARLNFWGAAVMSLPAAATGLLAWHFALDGQPLKGMLKLHLSLAVLAVIGIWTTIFVRLRAGSAKTQPAPWSFAILESGVCLIIGLAAHVGGFLSGVNV
jgi:uncharacterized membrane protein